LYRVRGKPDIQPRWTKEKDKDKAWEEDYEPSARDSPRDHWRLITYAPVGGFGFRELIIITLPFLEVVMNNEYVLT